MDTVCYNVSDGGIAMEKSFLHTKKVMLVDDEPDLLKLVSAILSDDGFENIVVADTVESAVNVCREEKPDIVILDVMLPDGDGFSLVRQIRLFTDVPIIFLTAKDEAADKLAGLGLGADDYIVKPFLPQELLLRVYAILRRCYKEESYIIKLDGCTIDFSRAEVNKNGTAISLTAKEHILLETLARNEGKIVTIDALCEALWGDNPFGYENSLNAHVRRIREKIEVNPSKPVSLITIKGLGYKLNIRK
jgi:DNA-binding response OmpR family regulator